MEGLDLETLGNSNGLGWDMWRRFKDRQVGDQEEMQLSVVLANVKYKSKGNQTSLVLEHMEQLGLVGFFQI